MALIGQSSETLRATVAALLHACGEPQSALATGIGLTPGQVSRKQKGTAAWSLDDLDKLAAHFGVPVPDLLLGPTHALKLLPDTRRAAVIGGRQTVLTVA